MPRKKSNYPYRVKGTVIHENFQPWYDEAWQYDDERNLLMRDGKGLVAVETYEATVATRYRERTAVALKKLLGERLESLTHIYINDKLVPITRADKKVETTGLGLKKGDVVEIGIPQEVDVEEQIEIKNMNVEAYCDLEYKKPEQERIQRKLELKRRHVFLMPQAPPTGDPKDWPKYMDLFDEINNLHLNLTYADFEGTWVSDVTGDEDDSLDDSIVFNPRKHHFSQLYDSEKLPLTQKRMDEWLNLDEEWD